MPKLGETYCHIDTIGLGDNSLKFEDDKVILNTIENEILKAVQHENVPTISAILVTESLAGDKN